MKRLLLPLVTLLSFCLSELSAEISPEKKADIVNLLEITGALDIAEQMSVAVNSQMTANLKQSHPDIPPEMFDVMESEINSVINERIPDFIDLIIPIYDQNFEHADITALIEFYRSDIGKKTIQLLPTLMQEGMRIGQEWGMSIAPEIQRRLFERFKENGIDLTA